jgi:hypothetical protein
MGSGSSPFAGETMPNARGVAPVLLGLALSACSPGSGGSGGGAPPDSPAITTASRKTNDDTPAIEGTAQPGAGIRVYEGETLLGTGAAAEDGTWRVHATVSLPDGPHALAATASNAQGESGRSASVDLVVDTIPPVPPTGLRFTVYGGTVDLVWDANAEIDLLGYHVWRKGPGEASFTRINAKVVAVPRYRDEGLTNGLRYDYQVTAVDDAVNDRGVSHGKSSRKDAKDAKGQQNK